MKFGFINRVRNKIRVNKSTHIYLGKNIKMVGCKIISKDNGNSIYVDDNTILRNVKIELHARSTLKIGKDCMIGDNCYLMASESTKIVIEDDCRLSRNAKVMASDGHPLYMDEKRVNISKDINIGTHVWIADNVTILKGVTVESGSIVGINSTVIKDIPKNSVCVGNPARVVKGNIRWED